MLWLLDANRGILILLLRLSHGLVLSYALVLLGRGVMDWIELVPALRKQLLTLDNILFVVTDPLLAPIRQRLSRLKRMPPDLDFSPFIGILFCWALDVAIVAVWSRLLK